MPPASLNETFRAALAQHQAGRLGEAQTLYAEVLRRDPRHFDGLHLFGLASIQAGRVQQGVGLIRQALGVRQDVPAAHYNLGNALLTLHRPEEALASFERALRLDPGDAQCLFEAGNALKDLRRLDEAIARYDAAIGLNPRCAEFHNNRGIALKDMGRLDDAVAAYDTALSLDPRYAEAHSNRGNALRDLGRLAEALASHDRALALRPRYAEAHYNRGNVLGELKRVDDALAAYDAALLVRGDYAEVLNNRAHLLLGAGRFAEGFSQYDARRESESSGMPALRTEVAAWDGRQCEGELLVWAEQGIGDEILHGSLLWLMPEGPLRITVAADRRLEAIYRRSLPERFRIIDSASLKEGVGAPYTAQAPVGDLGKLLGVDAAGLGRRPSPFLVADGGRRAGFRAALAGSGPVVGLSWKSSNPRIGREKSLGLCDLAPVLQVPGMSFVNLQYGAVSGDIAAVREALGVEVREAAGLDVFNDIDGLLALVDACDVVVTTSNVTAHLAGALGKRAAVLVPAGRGCLWYWQGGANDLWYPSLTRIAQPRIGEWDGAIAAAAAWLRQARLQDNGLRDKG